MDNDDLGDNFVDRITKRNRLKLIKRNMHICFWDEDDQDGVECG